MSETRKRRRVRISETPKKGRPSFIWIGLCLVIPPFWPIGALLLSLRIRNAWRWKKYTDYNNYAAIIGTEFEIPIGEIMSKMNKSREQVMLDLRTMIQKGFMGKEAYIDHARDVLVLDAEEARDAETFDRAASQYNHYAAVIGQADAMPLDEIAAAMGKNRMQVLFDIQTMIHRGYFGNKAYIDYRNEVFVLRDTKAQKTETAGKTLRRPIRVGNVASREAQPTEAPKEKEAKKEEPFEEILRKMRRLNDDIDDEAVSHDIDRIGELTSNIFGIVRAHPERRDEVRKFMDYYLPTTFSLLESYAMMEEQHYQSANIAESRKKIEAIMDKLVEAFEKQHDRMFQKEALDVDTEISVLETMLASDGLSGVPGADIHAEFERRRREGV